MDGQLERSPETRDPLRTVKIDVNSLLTAEQLPLNAEQVAYKYKSYFGIPLKPYEYGCKTIEELLTKMPDKVIRTVNALGEPVFMARQQEETKGIVKQLRNQNQEHTIRRVEQDAMHRNRPMENFFFAASKLAPTLPNSTGPFSETLPKKPTAPTPLFACTPSPNSPTLQTHLPATSSHSRSNSIVAAVSGTSPLVSAPPVKWDAFVRAPRPTSPSPASASLQVSSHNSSRNDNEILSKEIIANNIEATTTPAKQSSVGESRAESLKRLMDKLVQREGNELCLSELLETERQIVDHNTHIFNVKCENLEEEYVRLCDELPADIRATGENLRPAIASDLVWLNAAQTHTDLDDEIYLTCSILAFVPPHCLLIADVQENLAHEKFYAVNMKITEYAETNELTPLTQLRPGMECIGHVDGEYIRFILLGPIEDGHVRVTTLDHYALTFAPLSSLFEMPSELSSAALYSNTYLVRLRGIRSIFAKKQEKIAKKLEQLDKAGPLRAAVIFGRDPQMGNMCVADIIMDEVYLSELLIRKRLALPLESDPDCPNIHLTIKHHKEFMNNFLNGAPNESKLEEVQMPVQDENDNALMKEEEEKREVDKTTDENEEKKEVEGDGDKESEDETEGEEERTITLTEKNRNVEMDNKNSVAEQMMRLIGIMLVEEEREYDDWAMLVSFHQFCKAMTSNTTNEVEANNWKEMTQKVRQLLEVDKDRDEADD